jgi:hypothetical protein
MRLIIACLLFFCVKAIAAENVVDYKSPEAMGRGDSVISWSNNNLTNLFENPSFLSDSQNLSFDIINVGIDLSNNAVPLISHIPNVKNGDVYQELSPYFGNSYNAQGSPHQLLAIKGLRLFQLFIQDWVRQLFGIQFFQMRMPITIMTLGQHLAKRFTLQIVYPSVHL